MRRLNDGTLRRLYDEPFAVAGATGRHFRACECCQARFRLVAVDARVVSAVFSSQLLPVDTHAALHLVHERITAPAALAVGGENGDRATMATAQSRQGIVMGDRSPRSPV